MLQRFTATVAVHSTIATTTFASATASAALSTRFYSTAAAASRFSAAATQYTTRSCDTTNNSICRAFPIVLQSQQYHRYQRSHSTAISRASQYQSQSRINHQYQYTQFTHHRTMSSSIRKVATDEPAVTSASAAATTGSIETDELASSSSSSSRPSKPASEIYKGKARVYTKTGDKGTTSLFNMERRSKAEDYFSALGDTDELNANLGVVRSHCVTVHSPPTSASSSSVSNSAHTPAVIQSILHLDEQLSEIQSRLFDVGAHLATPLQSSNDAQIHRTRFGEHHVAQLEQWIDEMECDLPPLKNFILPSGGLIATHMHVSRSVCRRAERSTVPLVERGDSDPVVQRYLNRLSDYLFVAARYVTLLMNDKETIWKKPREPRPKKEKTDGNESE